MSQPKEKRARIQQEPGSSPSEHNTEAIRGSAGAFEERDMEAQSSKRAKKEIPPVQAVVLARPNTNAQSGIVLIARDGYETYIGARNEERDITEAGHLAKAAQARARDLYDDWKFVGPAVVYDYNPTNQPLQGLKADRPFNLRLREDREELDNNTPLHGHQDPDTQQLVDTFFVLVTAFEKPQPSQQVVPMEITPMYDQDIRDGAIALVSALLDTRNLRPGQFLQLPPHVVATAVNLHLPYDVILFRDAYQRLIQQIEDRMAKVKQPSTLIEVTGNPGIGKSTMIIFLLRHLFLQKKKVAHILAKSTVYYIPQGSDDGNITYEVVVVPANAEYDRTADAYVTDLKELPLIAFPGLYFWTHSPGAKTSSFLKSAVRHTLPVWSYAELKFLNDRLKQQYTNDDGTPKFPALSDEDLNANFGRWDGVPRNVMMPATDSEALLQQAFHMLQGTNSADTGVLKRAVTTYLENENLLDRLFLIAVDENFQPSARYWSKKTGAFIIEFFRENIHDLQRQFMELFHSTPEAHGTFGKLFEPFCHGLFSLGKALVLELKHLPRPEIKDQHGTVVENAEDPEDPQQLSLAAESISVEWFNTLEKLGETGVQPGMYYRPTYETMRSGDAFLLVCYVDDQSVTHNVLHIFQITVSRTHAVIGQGILDIVSLFGHVDNLEVRLVFLVPTAVSEGFRRQSYHKVGEKKVLRWSQQKKPLREVKQYVAGIAYGLPLPEADADEAIDEDDDTTGEPGQEVVGGNDEDAAGSSAAEAKNEISSTSST